MKALASAFDVNLRDLEYRETELINELLGKEVVIVPTFIGALYSVKGKIVDIQAPWLKLTTKKGVAYLHMGQIVQIAPL
jgi:hypothetical protein